MRRLVLPFIVACGLVMSGPSGAFADDPAPAVSVPSTPGKKICKIADKRLDELSGIVATTTGFIVINDSTDVPTHKLIFFLDTECKVVHEVSYSGDGPKDTEDLILSPNGKTLWLADTGDNNYDKDTRRTRIALWTMPADGSKKPVLHRLAYPPGDYHDAEALLLNGDGTPLIVTKEIGKPAYIYQPTGPLQVNNETGVPLRRVGQLTVSATTTIGNPYARIGNKTVDGGAIAPEGGKVVLRTYTDALEWDVTNGDVLGAIQQRPRTTALPNETLGEAITYSADGKTFYTVSDMSGDTETANYILQYTPATTVAVAKKDTTGAAGTGKKWYADLSIGDITYLVGSVGLLGLILVGIGLIGIVRHRKRVREAPRAGAANFGAALPDDPETELIAAGGAPPRAGVYAGPGPGPAVRSGPVTGAPAGFYGGAPGGGRGPVYGNQGGAAGPSAAGARGAQYGRPAGQAPSGGPQPGAPQPGRNGVYGGAPQGQAPQGARAPQPAAGPQGQAGSGAQGQRPQAGGAQRPQGNGAQRPPGGAQGRQSGSYGPQPGRPPVADGRADYRRP
jgi:hypothetical protein